MAVTEQQWIDQIAFELSFAMPGAPLLLPDDAALMEAVKGRLPIMWQMWASKSSLPFNLRILYFKRQGIELLLGALRNKTDGNLGPLVLRNSQKFKNLLDLHKLTLDEIIRLEKRLSANMGPASGDLLQTAPQMPADPVLKTTVVNGVSVTTNTVPQVRPDPNDQAYTGSPVRRLPMDRNTPVS